MHEHAMAHLLSRVSLFQTWKPKQIEEFLATRPFTIHNVEEGQSFVQRGDSYTDFMILLQGALRAEIPDEKGKNLIVETLRAPQCVASAVFFARRPVFPVSLVAVRRSQVLSMTRKDLLKLASEDRDVLEQLLGDMGDRLQFLAERLRVSRFQSLREKIVSYLMQEARKQGGPRVELAYRQGELADIFGVARPSLNRALKELESEGLIKLEAGIPQCIQILAFPAMKRILMGD